MNVRKTLPQQQGLYQPSFERDACGIGVYANIKGKETHEIIQQALTMLVRMEHRGGQGSDKNVGDGAGMMVGIPHNFFHETCSFSLPARGEYGVGMLFLPNEEGEQRRIKDQMTAIIREEQHAIIGWRTVPVNKQVLSPVVEQDTPAIVQVFIEKRHDQDEAMFQTALYRIRKKCEAWSQACEQAFYIVSLSATTLVYKGLLTPAQVGTFYVDLQAPQFMSAFALVHSRYSTNTFPSWERAHPNRYLVHNGEINTLTGNVQWMKAREHDLLPFLFSKEESERYRLLDTSGSDSSILDQAFEYFSLAGLDLAHVAMMLLPEPYLQDTTMDERKRAFYEYHSHVMEPWDGPTAIAFTNGVQIGAMLDRNGLRPARYYVTKDDHVILSSEVGVVDVAPTNILYKGRLSPGKMLLLDLQQGVILKDEDIKRSYSEAYPYREWVQHQITLPAAEERYEELNDVEQAQHVYGVSYEEVQKYLVALLTEGKDPMGSMGNDRPLAILSSHPQSLFSYFKQLFAQVTNPPIDALRETLVTSTVTYLGGSGHPLCFSKENCQSIVLSSPVLLPSEFAAIQSNHLLTFPVVTLPTLFSENLEKSIEQLCEEAERAVRNGTSILILSDRAYTQHDVPMPSLLSLSAVHQHLVSKKLRMKVSLLVDSGEVREVHHFATLLGYGADAIYPYLVYATYAQEEEHLSDSWSDTVHRYKQIMTDGIVKVMAKMGISTIQSYRGAQLFEAVGIGRDVMKKFFPDTVSQLSGLSLPSIALEATLRHEQAYNRRGASLPSGSDFQWRQDGEHHAFSPKTIHMLQWATRRNDYSLYKQYSEAANEEVPTFLRHLFTFKKRQAIPLEKVESVERLVQRFKTGAMSFGSISQEAHEDLARAMNALGGKSNSGEGGEDARRYTPDASGTLAKSAIKQIASGRFGVTSHYLVHANELQIKIAQGAKPGEGGQLPGNKVYPWVAHVRKSTPGVGLISPPPHHDIYSIEDLAQLIYDLKNANESARISVKLVSKSGVGTIAAGTAKGGADVIVISGYDGGTGASPKTSITHTGLPWELGLAETHQTLVLNDLRERVVIETDGKLMTGKDVVYAALLGAEEFGFATAPLIVLGCVMMRACHLDTCPVGIATQNPALRENYTGNATHVMNYMRFVAEEVREIMASLGFATFDEMVGRSDVLTPSKRYEEHWKARQLDLSPLLYQVPTSKEVTSSEQSNLLADTLDRQVLLPLAKQALQKGERLYHSLPITNQHRTVGTLLGSYISREYGEAGLPEDTLTFHFTGSAGQSFGAFLPAGLSLHLFGDANDYVGKGLSGGKVSVAAEQGVSYLSDDHVLIGNVAFYGATAGTGFIAGAAGERFAVRNSGGSFVVEGIGDHGCEYMTGGKVVILGDVGKNFGAGMSGGIAYLLPHEAEQVTKQINTEQVWIESLHDPQEVHDVRQLLRQHVQYTNSTKALHVLQHFPEVASQFIKVIPKEYKKMQQRITEQQHHYSTEEEAILAAFQSSTENKQSPQVKGASRHEQVGLYPL
ncbi:glutamate synthase large subunit [Fictibacillus macauensis ZFHKF-1]|uniref:Glutamate synthase large subunit n=1 Tax=Fictibacillus macauensis ZFHKF-1 TaxID=1196324 RepID=I8ALG7_9BACL|nr:glutamate synthase large subunit [Fictibacillus macauensis]EIT86747.1 glutamate synthase large subunit [Fictibacillus macauensis ZFHKF-1]